LEEKVAVVENNDDVILLKNGAVQNVISSPFLFVLAWFPMFLSLTSTSESRMGDLKKTKKLHIDKVSLAHNVSFWPQKLLKWVSIFFGPETAVNVRFWG
jgi:hypothetical protein